MASTQAGTVGIQGRLMTQKSWVTPALAACSVRGVATRLQVSGVRVSGLATQVLRVHTELDTEAVLQPEPLLKRGPLYVQDAAPSPRRVQVLSPVPISPQSCQSGGDEAGPQSGSQHAVKRQGDWKAHSGASGPGPREQAHSRKWEKPSRQAVLQSSSPSANRGRGLYFGNTMFSCSLVFL